jgi:hypothetical protein
MIVLQMRNQGTERCQDVAGWSWTDDEWDAKQRANDADDLLPTWMNDGLNRMPKSENARVFAG